MTWLRPLDRIDADDLPQVGHKAYYLGLLSQKQMPVATGQVIIAKAWQTALESLQWPHRNSAPDSLRQLDIRSFQALQNTSQQVQQALANQGLPPPLVTALQQWPHPHWILRASPWLKEPTAKTGRRPTGILSAQVGNLATTTLDQSLQQFWGQALSAHNLIIWQCHCPRLADLPLATLVMPLYPALASGHLTIQADTAHIQAVLGLGMPLSRGESIPARGRLPLANPAAIAWENGFQEQIYHATAISTETAQTGEMELPLRIIPAATPDLLPPLTVEQVKQLVQLGQQVQAILSDHHGHTHSGLPSLDISLEWLLCPHPEGAGWQFLITQAIPHFPASNPTQPSSPQPSSPITAPPLPAIRTVVRGIGASAGQVQGIAVVARQPHDLPTPLPANAIVVLPDLQPDVFLQLEAVAGIVTERGGATCHAAILAREIGVPAIVGAPQATQLLENETLLWLDGNRGVVYGLDPDSLPKASTQAFARPPHPPTGSSTAALSPDQGNRYRTLKTKVMANLSQLRRLSTLPMDHIAGIGLLRSEWLLLDILEGRHPWHWINHGEEAELQSRIVQQLEPILQALGPKPLRYRSLDLRSHEWQALEGSPPLEPNPMLGLRGTLSYDVDNRLFQVELAALATLQRAGYTNLQLILPFVRTVEEVLVCRQYINQAGLKDYADFALWIMAEVPSVLFLLPAYAQAGVQGIAIGSNDLTQLLLAVDRDQPILASAYDERHPVIQMAMAHLIQEAQRCGMTCSICGQAPVRHPGLIADLVAWGINSISVEAAALPFTLEAVWQAEQPP